MRVDRNRLRNGNILPSPHNVLAGLPKIALHHEKHGLRHPLGAFNNSLGRCTRALRALLDKHDEVQAMPASTLGDTKSFLDEVAKTAEELLEAMFAYVEAGYGILKSLTPPPERNPREPFNDRWLEAIGHPSVGSYKANVKLYRNSLAPIINKVKHEGGTFGTLLMHGPDHRIPGYYLNGPTLGPDPSVHPNGTAYSLARDMRFHACALYLVGEHLTSAITDACKKQLAITVDDKTLQVDDGPEYETIQRVAKLPLKFYPDEVKKPFPLVQTAGENEEAVVSAAYPLPNRASAPRGGSVVCFLGGDGATDHGLVPYMALNHRLPGGVRDVRLDPVD